MLPTLTVCWDATPCSQSAERDQQYLPKQWYLQNTNHSNTKHAILTVNSHTKKLQIKKERQG
jgi:hypothetical protein